MIERAGSVVSAVALVPVSRCKASQNSAPCAAYRQYHHTALLHTAARHVMNEYAREFQYLLRARPRPRTRRLLLAAAQIVAPQQIDKIPAAPGQAATNTPARRIPAPLAAARTGAVCTGGLGSGTWQQSSQCRGAELRTGPD